MAAVIGLGRLCFGRLVVQRWVVEHFDEHDAAVNHVKDDHSLVGEERHIAVTGAVGAAGWRCGVEALAEVVPARARGDDVQVLCPDRYVRLR